MAEPLLGEVVAEELHMLAQCQEIPPLDRLGVVIALVVRWRHNGGTRRCASCWWDDEPCWWYAGTFIGAQSLASFDGGAQVVNADGRVIVLTR